MALWTFNDFLEKVKLDPERVYLMRHQDTRKDVRRSNYRLWRDNPEKFREFERWQGRSTPSKKGFPKDSYIAAFVVDSSGSTLFVGLSRVVSISGYEGGAVIYNLETDNRLKDYEGFSSLNGVWINGRGCNERIQSQSPLLNCVKNC